MVPKTPMIVNCNGMMQATFKHMPWFTFKMKATILIDKENEQSEEHMKWKCFFVVVVVKNDEGLALERKHVVVSIEIKSMFVMCVVFFFYWIEFYLLCQKKGNSWFFFHLFNSNETIRLTCEFLIRLCEEIKKKITNIDNIDK